MTNQPLDAGALPAGSSPAGKGGDPANSREIRGLSAAWRCVKPGLKHHQGIKAAMPSFASVAVTAERLCETSVFILKQSQECKFARPQSTFRYRAPPQTQPYLQG